ncbi:hypothetical protein [Pseudoscardovia suis]|uniref:Uncharacterized protein n=1 Tax=Pseudoscardovia suis TaxID=987063 RepID=A0A261EPQ7_9BIFI|nr:hypothetical protein [Pseudoscardovia suis]OZG48839.1 hypothetical protein PSSU_1663 [Pseudoscardovia suis]PJJ63983.1 hypothetical protein CLV65_1607 [Pseudoscardovia suis]
MTKKKYNANREIMQADSVSSLGGGVFTYTFDLTDGMSMPVRVLTGEDGEPFSFPPVMRVSKTGLAKAFEKLHGIGLAVMQPAAH